MKIFLKKSKNVIINESGQAMTEYALTLALLVAATIPAIKLIPAAFGVAFDKITTAYSMHTDELMKKVLSLKGH